MTSSPLRVLISVIAFNEERNIVAVLKELQAFRDAQAAQPGPAVYEIAVIDNASTDSTPDLVAQSGFPLVRHPVNNGGSMGTVLSYFRYAEQGGYDVLIQFDGDGQHIASEIPAILTPIVAGKADYVVGSRYLERKGFQSTILRRIGIRLFNIAIHWACGERVSDSTSGFRAYNRKIINFFAKNFSHELTDPIQLRILSKYCGGRICEVPVQMRERSAGKSEFDAIRSIRFMIKGLVTVFGCYLQKAQLQRTMEKGSA